MSLKETDQNDLKRMYFKLLTGSDIKSESQVNGIHIRIESLIDLDCENTQEYFSFFKERILFGESLAVHFIAYLIDEYADRDWFKENYLSIREELKSVAINLRMKNQKYDVDFSDGLCTMLYADEHNRKIIAQDMSSFKDILNETGRYYLDLWNKELNKKEAEQ